MTTPPIQALTDELLGEIEASAINATQGNWCTDGNSWVVANDSDQLNAGYVLFVCEGPDAKKNADYTSKADPVVVSALITELRRLRAENAELAQSLAESRANDQAAMGWLTSLRLASGDRGERMLPELVTHIEGLAKDAGRYRWMRDGAGYCDTRDIPGMAPLRMDEYIDTAMERPQ